MGIRVKIIIHYIARLQMKTERNIKKREKRGGKEKEKEKRDKRRGEGARENLKKI